MIGSNSWIRSAVGIKCHLLGNHSIYPQLYLLQVIALAMIILIFFETQLALYTSLVALPKRAARTSAYTALLLYWHPTLHTPPTLLSTPFPTSDARCICWTGLRNQISLHFAPQIDGRMAFLRAGKGGRASKTMVFVVTLGDAVSKR